MATVATQSKRPNNGDTVKTRPQRRLTQAELDAFLEKAAHLLRGGIDHSEFRGYVFALLFYKRISDVYLENVAALEKERLTWKYAMSPELCAIAILAIAKPNTNVNNLKRTLTPRPPLLE